MTPLERELVTAGFIVEHKDGALVVGHILKLEFQPYKLQRLNKVAQWRPQERRAKVQAPRPIGVNSPPSDKYEYWDYLTEKALETHQRIADNAAERKQQRLDNQNELRDAMREAWGEPKLTTLHSILRQADEENEEKRKEDEEMRKQTINPDVEGV